MTGSVNSSSDPSQQIPTLPPEAPLPQESAATEEQARLQMLQESHRQDNLSRVAARSVAKKAAGARVLHEAVMARDAARTLQMNESVIAAHYKLHGLEVPVPEADPLQVGDNYTIHNHPPTATPDPAPAQPAPITATLASTDNATPAGLSTGAKVLIAAALATGGLGALGATGAGGYLISKYLNKSAPIVVPPSNVTVQPTPVTVQPSQPAPVFKPGRWKLTIPDPNSAVVPK